MKAITCWAIATLFLVNCSCRQTDGLNDGKPAIRSISFMGIPSQNVQFDAPNARITVQLPAVLKGGLQPVFELTDQTRVIDGVLADNTIDLSTFCICDQSSKPKKVILRVGNQKTTAVYELVVVATGPLRAQNTNEQFSFSRQTKRLELSLPVENLYNNPYVNTLVFTDLATGFPIQISADAVCLNGCIGTAPNRMTFSLGSPIERYLKPGTYSISLNGINFPQRLVVTD